MMARMTPVSLHFSDVPTGWKNIFTDKQQLATGFACSSRTVSPDEHCYRLILHQGIEEIICAAANTDGGFCLPSNDTFSSKQLANQLLPDSVRFLVAKNILEPIQRSQAQMKECVVEFVHQRHPPLHGFRIHIPSTVFLAEHTYISKYFMRHVCAPKFCLLLTAVMSNDVGAAAEYLSTPRPIIGWHHLLLLHLKTECNTM